MWSGTCSVGSKTMPRGKSPISSTSGQAYARRSGRCTSGGSSSGIATLKTIPMASLPSRPRDGPSALGARRAAAVGLLTAVIALLAHPVPADAHSFTTVIGCVQTTSGVLRLVQPDAPCGPSERLLTWKAGSTEYPRTLVYACADRSSGALRRVPTWRACRQVEQPFRWQGDALRGAETDIHACVD